MIEYTKEPWEMTTGRANIGGHGHLCWVIGTAYGVSPGEGVGCAIVILPDENDTPEARIERKATARRIVACVNACAGIATADLEYGTPLDTLLADAAKIRRERDEAVEALKDVLALPYCDAHLSKEISRSVLSKLEGGCNGLHV